MKKIILFVLLGIFLIGLIAASIFIIAHLGGINRNLAECSQDSDCVKVQTTCCPCEMGGQEKCIGYNLLRNYQDNLKACPPEENLICPAMYNCEINSCGCINGTCVSRYSA